jgi:hypothetical protein
MATTATRSANESLAAQFAPIRYVLKATGKGGYVATAEWAGSPKQSILQNSAQVRSDVLSGFKKECGFSEAQLEQTRAVKYQYPIFYEVWVFKDPQSKRDDGLSGVSVILKQLPNGGGVDFSLQGDCHSKKSPVFYYAG